MIRPIQTTYQLFFAMLLMLYIMEKGSWNDIKEQAMKAKRRPRVNDEVVEPEIEPESESVQPHFTADNCQAVKYAHASVDL